MVASFGQPGMAMYGASRAAIELLTKAGKDPRRREDAREYQATRAPSGLAG